ncbi:tape measure protein [Mycobacterium phage Bigfoot]|nr:tape measure protein [Mycobacterium phage Bigfoot]
MAAGKEVGRLSIKVTPDLDGFYRELKQAVEAAERMKAKIPVEPDMGNFRQEVRAGIANLPEAKVKVNADVSQLSKLRARLATSGGGFGGGGGGGLGGFADTLALVAAVAVIAAPALALISGALVSLPAIVASVATPIGVIALGLDGIKKAAEQLAKPLEDLKTNISGVFEARLTPVFGQLGTLFPMLNRSLPSVANGIADMAQGFTDAVTSLPGMVRIENTIGNIGKFLTNLKPGVDGFTQGLLGLAEGVTNRFPQLGDFISNAGKSFSDWVNEVAGNGKLDSAITNFGSTLKELGGIIVDLAKQGFEWLADPEFGDKMTNFAKNLRQVVNDILPDLESLFSGFAALIDTLVKAYDKLKGRGENLDGPDRVKPETIGPEFDGVRILKDNPISRAWNESKESFLAMSEVIEKQLATVFTTIAAHATVAWNNIKNTASQAIMGITTAFSLLPGFLSGTWNAITTSFSTVWLRITTAAQAGARSVLTAISSSFSSIGSIISNAFSVAVNAVRDAFNQMVSAAVEGAARVLAEIQALPGKIAAAAGNFGSALVAAGKALMDGLLSGIKAGLESVLSFASGIAAKIAAVKGPLPKDRKELIPAGEALMEGLGTGLENGLDPVLDRAKQMAKQIFEAFKETFGTAPGAVAFNLGGGTAALQSSLGDVQTSLQSTLDTSQELNKSFAEPIAGAADGSSLLSDDMKQQIKDVQDQMDLLELQRKQLKVQKNEAGSKEDKAAIQEQINALQAEKDKLAYQKDQLKIQQKQTGELGEQKTLAQFFGEQIASTWQQGTDAVAGFARANLDQAMGDLGIGGGALTNGLNAALDWGTQAVGNIMNIQVNSVDDAIAVKNNEVAKQALTYTRR